MECASSSSLAAAVVEGGDGLRRSEEVTGLTEVALSVGLAFRLSFAEEEKVDLGFDCALKDSDFWVDPLGGIVGFYSALGTATW